MRNVKTEQSFVYLEVLYKQSASSRMAAQPNIAQFQSHLDFVSLLAYDNFLKGLQ